MQVGPRWLLLLAALGAGAARADAEAARPWRKSPRPIKTDQDSLPASETPEGTRPRNAGELGPGERPPGGPRRDDIEFIRVEPGVETGVSKQHRTNGPAAAQPERHAHKHAPTARPKSEPDADRTTREPDRPDGATSGRLLALRQSAGAAGPPAGPGVHPDGQAQFDSLSRLYLDSSMPLEVRTHLGETAHLVCRLRANLQQSDQLQVSWFRRLEILTSGEMRYTGDERFQASHPSDSSDWLLELRNVRAADEGDYECQVNTAPRAASVRVRLVVIATSLQILEGPEVRVGAGEPMELTCRVQFASQAQLASEAAKETPVGRGMVELGRTGGRRRRAVIGTAASNWQPYIYWYKDQVYLQDGRVERRQRNLSSGGLENVLRVGRAGQADGGSYTCKLVPELTEVRPARAQVFVISNGCAGRELGLVAVALAAASALAWDTCSRRRVPLRCL